MFLAPPRQLGKTFQPTSGKSAGSSTLSPWTPVKTFYRSERDWADTKMRGLVVLVTLTCFATAQHQALIDYLERRLLAIEVRLTLPPCRALRSSPSWKENFQGQGTGNGMQMWAHPEENVGKFSSLKCIGIMSFLSGWRDGGKKKKNVVESDTKPAVCKKFWKIVKLNEADLF